MGILGVWTRAHMGLAHATGLRVKALGSGL